MNRLAGHVAWVTGAGTGIGRGIALALAREGADVILSSRRREPLEETAAEVASAGRRAAIAPLDVTDRDQIDEAVNPATERLGPVSILVNNAGVNTPLRTATEMAVEDWDLVVDINLTGAFNCFRAVYEQMKARGGGNVINVASMAGRQVSLLGGAAYCASKHGMVSLTHSINLEAAEFGLRACAILPGEVKTPILKNRPQPVSEKRLSLMLTPEDIADTVVFVLCQPAHVVIPEMWVMPAYQVSAQPLP
ncbi:MAG: SDR family NAD(P)-dependent oxidoreductase [Gemmatimonadetes bacterium]|nr:SDR family NAD(P)-dependent oxidoreductase [Gemmatimonadota bacterium]